MSPEGGASAAGRCAHHQNVPPSASATTTAAAPRIEARDGAPARGGCVRLRPDNVGAGRGTVRERAGRWVTSRAVAPLTAGPAAGPASIIVGALLSTMVWSVSP